MKRLLVLALIGLTLGSWGLARPLEIWQNITFSPTFNEALSAMVREWAAETGTEVNLVTLPDRVFNEQLLHAIETRVTPDLALVAEFGDALAHAAGLLAPIDNVVERLGRDNFWPEALTAMYLPDPETGENRIFGLPILMEPFYWHIRTDLLEQAGIEIPEHPTWEWLLEAAKAVHNPPHVYGLPITLGVGMDTPTTLYFLVALYGGGFVTEISPTGADIFNTEPTWRLFDDLKQWWRDGLIPRDSVAWGDIDNNIAFMEGRAFAIHNPTTVLATMIAQNHPLLPVTGVINIHPVIEAKESVMVFRSTPEREALAQDLLYHILSDAERLRIEISDNAGMYGLPLFKSQGDIVSQMIRDRVGVYKHALHDLVEPIRRGEFYMWCNTIPFPYGQAHPAWEAIWGAGEIPRFLSRLVLEDVDSRAMAAEMAAWMNSILARWAE